jgi:hypothetical protein
LLESVESDGYFVEEVGLPDESVGSVSVVTFLCARIDTHDRFTKVTAKDDSFQYTSKAKVRAPLPPPSCSPSSNDLGQYQTDIDDLDLVTRRGLVRLRNRIRHDQLLQPAILNDLERRPTEDPMGDDGVYLGSTFLEQSFGSESKGTTGICHVIDEDGDLASNGTDEDHTGDLAGLFTFLVEEGEFDVESIGDRGRSGMAADALG